MLSPVRLSVRLSATRRYCVKTKKASVMISSLSSILVFWCQILSRNSQGFPRAGSQRRVGWENQPFSGFKRQYLENGRIYGWSYYGWLIGSCIWAFDWHQDLWPWMTMNCYMSEICRNFAWFRIFGRQQQLNEETNIYSNKIITH